MSGNLLRHIAKILKREGNYLFFRRYRYWRTVRRHFAKFYSPHAPLPPQAMEPTLVCMADGRCLHGGLCDRLRGFTAYYEWCMEHGMRFAIYFRSPFTLEEYLEPNGYDWRIDDTRLTYNSTVAHAVYMDFAGEHGPREDRFRLKLNRKMIAETRFRQHHVYSPLDHPDTFGATFRHLFRPTERIRRLVDGQLSAIGSEFISVSCRFMELLGDFKEPKAKGVLSEADRRLLIDRCLEQIQKLHAEHPRQKVLLTADSPGFLDEASARLPYVWVIPGTVAHVDTAGSSADHTKTFLDFLLIGHAVHAYQLRSGGMYGGAFSASAAAAGNVPFTRIDF